MDVRLPDGTIIKGVPDGTSRMELAQKLKSNGRAVPDEWLRESYGEGVQRTSAAFDKAASAGGPGGVLGTLNTAGNTAAAALDVGTGIATGVAGDIAGFGTSLVTQDPKKGEAVKRALTVEPESAAGKAGQEYVGALAKPIGELAGKPAAWLKAHGYPIAAQGLTAAEDVLGGGELATGAKATRALVRTGAQAARTGAQAARSGARVAGETAVAGAQRARAALPAAVREGAGRIAAKGEERAAVRAAEEAPKQDKVAAARSLGIKIPPSEVTGAPAGKVLEGAGGKIQTEQAFSRANAKVLNRKAGAEIGLSERQSLTPANIERAKQKAFTVYDRVKKAGRITLDGTYREALGKVKERTAGAAEDFPEDTNELIDKEIAKFDRPSADASSMLEKIKSLRSRAGRNMQSPDAEKFELGIAQKKIATAMEEAIERAVPDKGLIADFRAARQQLAKIYNVEEALGPSGNVNAAVLARQLKRGVPLSGNLKAIAELYGEFPRVLRSVDALGGHAAFSALDYLVGGVEAAANPHAALRIVGALAGRPLARGIIGSRPYQRAAVKAREVTPSLPTRAARAIAGPQSPALGTTIGEALEGPK
jgi:hypothetical protein